MKKIIIVMLIVFVTVGLCGCNKKYSYKISNEITDITNIEIVNFSENEKTILGKITNCDELITELNKLSGQKYWNDPCQTIDGKGVIIYYGDSSYEIITCYCSAYYNDDTVNYSRIYFDSGEFENFINLCLTLTEISQ